MILSFEANEKYSSATEFFSLQKAAMYLPESKEIIYLGFPWTDLFNAIETGQPDQKELTEYLHNVKDSLFTACRVVTVCEHKNFLPHRKLMVDLGITDVFWSHAGFEKASSSEEDINIHPFPIYPNDSLKTRLTDEDFFLCIAEERFDPAMLWRCINQGVIPVIPESSYILPGNKNLWRQATILRDKKDNNYSFININKLAKDQETIYSKKSALRQLAHCYGQNFLITDIVNFFFSPESKVHKPNKNPLLKIDCFNDSVNDKDMLFLSFISNLMLDPEETKKTLRRDYFLRKKLLHTFNKSESRKRLIFQKALLHYGVNWN